MHFLCVLFGLIPLFYFPDSCSLLPAVERRKKNNQNYQINSPLLPFGTFNGGTVALKPLPNPQKLPLVFGDAAADLNEIFIPIACSFKS